MHWLAKKVKVADEASIERKIPSSSETLESEANGVDEELLHKLQTDWPATQLQWDAVLDNEKSVWTDSVNNFI